MLLKHSFAIKNIATYAVFTRAKYLFLSVFVLLLSACATGPNANPNDPLEPFNRGVYAVNDALDKAVLAPTARVYQAVTPSVVRAGVGNFFSNLGDVWTTVNSVLQLRGQKAVESTMRFAVNTVFGFAGVLDIASEMGIPKHYEDFGQTLGRWGMPAGPFVMLPIFGPSTLRDTAAFPVDSQGNLISYVNPERDRWAATVLNAVNTRAELFKSEQLLNQVALDRYSFIRDAYLQRRRAAVFDGDLRKNEDDEPPTDKAQKSEAAEKPASAEKPPAAPANPAAAATPAAPAEPKTQ
jgi:phospholipid-binding lipoprotein MlaA